MIPFGNEASAAECYFACNTVKGFFLQDDDQTPDGSRFDYVSTSTALKRID
jgi:hypothetical protein